MKILLNGMYRGIDVRPDISFESIIESVGLIRIDMSHMRIARSGTLNLYIFIYT